MKRLSKIFLLTITLALAGLVAAPLNASAITLEEDIRCDGCPENLFGENGIFRTITDNIIYIIGIIAVIMLIWGGLRYVLSGGDTKKVTDAKNTVLYAIIGLVVSLLSYAAVSFVIEALPSADHRNDNTSENQSQDKQDQQTQQQENK